MNHSNASLLADSMCRAADELWECYSPEFKGATFSTRRGTGKRTYHKRVVAPSGRRTHELVFGVKMIIDKCESMRNLEAWLCSKEIMERRYQGGEVTTLNSLVHTVVHEFAHALQTNRGFRERGSVHNADFYCILDEMYDDGAQHIVREMLEKDIAYYRLDLSFVESAEQTAEKRTAVRRKARAAMQNFYVGAQVEFTDTRRGKQNRLVVGTVHKLNKKTATVYEDNKKWGVPFHMLRKREG